jgi:glycosyltransferase involved in cell wall biosynthesis
MALGNSQKQRVIIFSNAYKPTLSGVVTSIDLFRRGLITAGHDVHLIAPVYEDYQDEEPYVFRFPAMDLTNWVDASVVLPLKSLMEATVRGIKPTIIHSQHPLLMGDLAVEFAKEYQAPLVFTFHTLYDAYAQKYVPIVQDLIGKMADDFVRGYLEKCTHIVAPTHSIRELIREKYVRKIPISVVPTPIDLSQYKNLAEDKIRDRLGLKNAEILLFLGRIAEEKNLDFLLKVFKEILVERPGVKLLIVGKGTSLNSIERLAGELGITRDVLFTGAVPHHEVPDYMAAADVFVFPSEVETQGLVLIEAMAAGTPAVAVVTTGSQDVLANGGGILVSSDEVAFKKAVLDLLTNNGYREIIGEKALQVARSYTIEAATSKMEKVYDEAKEMGFRPKKKKRRRIFTNSSRRGS